MTVRSPGKCGCCEGLKVQTPQEIYNRPGLSSIKYRSGNYSLFKESLTAGLSDTKLFSDQELEVMKGLQTREDDDFSIALLDAWALVSDVLTFYQERIANECYLRTATEEESIRSLARLIGYRPCPGVAASTPLAFFMETAEGAPESAVIECKTKVQSIPGPGEVPCIFETVERIEARGKHNELRPRLTQKHPLKMGQNTFYFQGLATGLRPGDGVFVNPEDGKPYFCLVAKVTLLPQEHKTQVLMQPPLKMETERERVLAKIRNRQKEKEMQPGTNGLVMADSVPHRDENDYANMSALVQASPVREATKGEFVRSEDYYAWATTKGTTSAKKFANYSYVAESGEREEVKIFEQILAGQLIEPTPIESMPVGVIAFRIRANIFGHNAPRFDSLPSSLAVGTWGPVQNPDNPNAIIRGFAKGPYFGRQDNWVDKDTRLGNYCLKDEDCRSHPIFLDNEYAIAKGAPVLLKDKNNCKIFWAKDVVSSSKSDFTLTSKITSMNLQSFDESELSILGIENQDILNEFTVRGTTVFSGGERLSLSDVPYTDSVSSEQIDLDGFVDGLWEGRTVIVCGLLDEEGKRGSCECEQVTISSSHLDEPGGFTRIFLKEGLKNTYFAKSVKIYANVALATVGETKEEILGSGDCSLSFQRFHLLNSPLTYVSAQNSQGASSTLHIYVDEVQWQDTASLFDKGPSDRVYTVQIDPQGKTTVMFGDGRNGARLPTGQENVKAVYRKGLGSAGNVAADKISLLLSMPLGLRSVKNPQAASGGCDPEDLENARLNMPLGIVTMDRLVSLKDYEAFARAFAGVGKALATRTWNGRVRGVFVTIAGPLGETFDKDNQVYKNLLGEMQRQGDPFVPVDLVSYSKVLFRIAARVGIKTGYEAKQVFSEVRSRVLSSFSFSARSFGQPVILSEVIGLIKSVPGVTAVDVSKLYKVDEACSEDLFQRLQASAPLSGQEAAEVTGAQLLIIDPIQPFDSLEVMS